ncbi:hypothetical protein RRG08_047651 [Elysia crispata]|uniref:Uncharacterized protein n=1 Tax=Elysia crispata TaxID=231223 RepID=A0AAE0ZXF6_9GAST|nr:hypothetical protein RRG08_047651 [Elysia crispata]
MASQTPPLAPYPEVCRTKLPDFGVALNVAGNGEEIISFHLDHSAAFAMELNQIPLKHLAGSLGASHKPPARQYHH